MSDLEDLDTYFIKLNPKDVYFQSHKIREHSLVYYTKGSLTSFINIFTRYIKFMKDLNESEMQNFIIKFLIASIIKKNYETAISDLQYLRPNFITYDINIYIL